MSRPLTGPPVQTLAIDARPGFRVGQQIAHNAHCEPVKRDRDAGLKGCAMAHEAIVYLNGEYVPLSEAKISILD